MDLVLLNVGSTPTCIRAQGSSIVDLTWCSPDRASKIDSWKVGDDEILSDHSLVEINLRLSAVIEGSGRGYGRQASFPRWSLIKMNWDLLKAAITLKYWLCPQPIFCDPEEAAVRLGQLLEEACNVAAPRARKLPRRRQTYWWNEKLAEGRKACIALRRKMVKFRRLGKIAEAENSRVELQSAQRKLRTGKAEAKKRVWNLLALLEQDP